MFDFKPFGTIFKYAVLYWILCLTLILYGGYLPNLAFTYYPMNTNPIKVWRESLMNKIANNYDSSNSFINLKNHFKTTSPTSSVAAATDFPSDVDYNSQNSPPHSNSWFSTFIVIITVTTKLFLNYLREALAVSLGFAFMFTNFRGLIDIPFNFINFMIGNNGQPSPSTSAHSSETSNSNGFKMFPIGRILMKFVRKIVSSFFSVLNTISGGRLPTPFLTFQDAYGSCSNNDSDENYNGYGFNCSIYDNMPALESDPLLLPMYINDCVDNENNSVTCTNNSSNFDYSCIVGTSSSYNEDGCNRNNFNNTFSSNSNCNIDGNSSGSRYKSHSSTLQSQEITESSDSNNLTRSIRRSRRVSLCAGCNGNKNNNNNNSIDTRNTVVNQACPNNKSKASVDTESPATVDDCSCCVFDPVYGVIPTHVWMRWQEQQEQQSGQQQYKNINLQRSCCDANHSNRSRNNSNKTNNIISTTSSSMSTRSHSQQQRQSAAVYTLKSSTTIPPVRGSSGGNNRKSE